MNNRERDMIYFFERERGPETDFSYPITEKDFSIIDLLVDMQREPIFVLNKKCHNEGDLYSVADYSIYGAQSVYSTNNPEEPDVKIAIRKKVSNSKGETQNDPSNPKFDIIVLSGHESVVSAFDAGVSIRAKITKVIDKTKNIDDDTFKRVVPFSRVKRELYFRIWEKRGLIGD